MNFRQTAILIGAVFAGVVVLLVLSFTATETGPATDVLTEELARVKPEDIDSVEMDRDTGGRVKMVRAGKDKWEIVEPFRAPADAGAVQAVVVALMKAKPTASNELTSNPAVHGLEPPGLKVTLRQGDGKSSTVNFGDVTLGGNKSMVFVTTSTRTRPMAVPRGEVDALLRDAKGSGKFADLAKWVSDFRLKTVFPSDSRAMGEDVTALKLELPAKKKELTLTRTPVGGWKFDSPAGWGDADVEGDSATPPGSFTGVAPLLRALANVAAGATADFIDSPKDMKEYGLNADNPDRIRIELKTKDGQTAVAYFGKFEAGAAPPPPIPGMPPQPPAASGKVFLSVEGQPGVIRANAANLSGLAALVADPNPLRDRDLIPVARGKSVDGVDIVLAGQAPDKPTKLRKVGGDWKLYGGPGDPQTAYALTANKIAEVAGAKRSIKDFPALNPADFATVTATVYVWVDGFTAPADPKAEPAKKAEPVKLEFGRVDGETVYVRRTLPGGAVGAFTLPTAVRTGVGAETLPLPATVAKARLDLIDPALPTFGGAGAAQRVTVTGQATYDLEKDGSVLPPADPLWRFVAPDHKGRVADAGTVAEMLRLLGTTQTVSRYVDEQPTPEKLNEYGLGATPRLKAVVKLSDGERVYEFGKDTPEPGFVYARFGGKPAVFTLPHLLFDKLAAPDLRDRFVFRALKPSDVTRVELRGWVGLVGKEQIRVVLEKKDGVWVVPPTAPGARPNAPPGFALDPAKVDAFLTLLSTTQVKTFETGKPDPKHGFGDQDPFVEANVYGPWGMTFLNIGNATPDGSAYYVVTNAIPDANPVVTIEAAPFKPYKEKPTAFAK